MHMSGDYFTACSGQRGKLITQTGRMMVRVFLLLLCGACTSCLRTTSAPQFSPLKVRDHWMVDGDGRVRFFHGFNAVQKSPPWYPSYLLNATRLRYLEEWGMNAVRLGTMWSGVYPEENMRNDTYLNIMNNIINKLGDHGMYVLFDMHQDGLTSLYGSYDGAPTWLIKKYPKPRFPYPEPFKKVTFWMYNYLTDATGEAFQNMYNNVSGSMDYWAEFWQTVATKLGKPNKNILGYELINEPWAGDIYADPFLLLPGRAGADNLQPTYDRLSAAIRKVDEQALIFYEPVTWGMLLNGSYVGSGFDHVPGGPAYRDRSVLSYHYYCWFMGNEPHKPYPKLNRYVCDDVLGPEVFKTIKIDVAKLGGSSLLTEFGICAPDGKVNSSVTVECEFVLNQADKNLQSWTYWDSIFFDGNGDVIWDTARGFARTYARAVSGIPVSMSFNSTTAEFSLWYHLDQHIPSPTEIFVPPLHYPKGFTVSLSDGLTWMWDSKLNVVLVKTKKSVKVEESLAKVYIRPK